MAAAGAQQPGLLRGLIEQHEQALAAARGSHNMREEASELNQLASLYREAGDPHKGLDYCAQALSIETSRGQQAQSKNTEGRILTDLGQEQKAMDLFNEILPVWRELRILQGEASTLTNMGRVYNDLGEHDKAIEVLNQALPEWRQVTNRGGEANALDNLGRAYADLGQGQKALEFLNQALPLWKDVGEMGGEAQTLNNTGRAWWDIGEYEKALDAYREALPLWKELGHPEGEAATLNLIGRVEDDLNEKQAALDHFGQALPLWQQVGNRSGVAVNLFDSGRIYIEMGQMQKALDLFQQALAIWRETQDRRGQAAALTMIGRTVSNLGDREKALDFDLESLAAWREVGDIRGQAFALNSIGRAYSDEGKIEMALPQKLAALELARQANDPDLDGGIEASLMLDFRSQKRLEEAIFFGTEAVNHYQQIRRNISGLDQSAQVQFVESKAPTYRILAELLMQTNRLGGAEQVLDLLKEEELREVVTGTRQESRAAPLLLTAAEQQVEKDLAGREPTAAGLADLNAQIAALEAKTARTPDENAQLKTLEAKIEAANRSVSDFFRTTLYPELAQKGGTAEANAAVSQERSEVSRLENTLADLGPGVIGIRLLLGDQQAYALVVTAQSRRKYDLKATPAELEQKVEQIRNELRTPSSDPKPDLAALYAMVVAPFEPELTALEHAPQEKDRAPTLLWSLDGSLRYLPMAALYDGHRYLAERFNNVLFTPESYGRMMAPAAGSAGLRVLAMGLSKSYGGLPALPGVMPELDAVVHDPAVPDSHGPIDGVLLPDDRFTWAALKQELGPGPGPGFAVVHIASHFVLETGRGTEPYLMMGGDEAGDAQGFALTLSRLEDSTVTFHGTRLLTLSACSTAKGDVASDGLEMDSLGMVAQQKDAEAVLATLWDVNDASTSRIMSDFYRRWVTHAKMGKAEAMRQAQLAFLHAAGTGAKAAEHRGVATVDDNGAAARAGAHYAHPFYWAPFVLMGNYQ
jgi:CHAT domain-containing protein